MSLKWTRYGPGVLPAWVAEMDFPVAPAIKQAMRDAVEHELFAYATDESKAELAAACIDWQDDRYGWRVEHVHVLPDVLKGVELGIALHSPAGSPVVVPTPAYPPLFDVVRQCGRPIVEVPMDLDRIEQALAAGARTVLLCNPNNPLGTVAGEAELKALSAVVDRYGARVVADEVHAPIVHPGHRHVPYASASEAAAAHTVTVTSASKGWNLPGLKCAQAVLSNAADETIWAALPTLRTWGAGSLGIIANTAAYRSGRAWLDDVLRTLDANRQHLAARLGPRLTRVPEGTYLAWLDFRDVEDPAGFFLREARVALSDGTPYGAPGHVRLNFATTPVVLDRIITRMLEAL